MGTRQDDEVPQFMRSAENVELRGECPRPIVNALDACSMARDITRTQLVNEILGQWAALRRHENSLLAKLDDRNPAGSEQRGGPSR